MAELTRHPLYATTDAVLRALKAQNICLYDRNYARELERIDHSFPCMVEPADCNPNPVFTNNGLYQLRTRLLPTLLEELNGTANVRAAGYGRIYDRADEALPSRMRVEGVLSEDTLPMRDLKKLWNHIVKDIFGIIASADLAPATKDLYEVKVTLNEKETTIGCTGPATWLARSVLGASAEKEVWAFCIDIDTVALLYTKLPSREELYSIATAGVDSALPSYGNSFVAKITDVLRAKGFNEFSGMKFYPDGIYQKMNMIQASWDTNNVGVQLDEPLGEGTGLPTVLTPSLEQALADLLNGGYKTARIFEIGHIFKPGKNGEPSDKLSLSIGVSDPSMNIRSFIAEMRSILTELGISNHFFFPTDMAIAYNTRECMIILDEKMSYLDANFGGISEIAEKNFDIPQHSFMAQFEIPTLEKKADEEYNFIPPEEQ